MDSGVVVAAFGLGVVMLAFQEGRERIDRLLLVCMRILRLTNDSGLAMTEAIDAKWAPRAKIGKLGAISIWEDDLS